MTMKSMFIKALLIASWLEHVIRPYLKPSMFFSFGTAWMITNGWAYLFITFGSGILKIIGGFWATMLWFPLTIEKPITIAIALWIQKTFFIKRGVTNENTDYRRDRKAERDRRKRLRVSRKNSNSIPEGCRRVQNRNKGIHKQSQ